VMRREKTLDMLLARAQGENTPPAAAPASDETPGETPAST
jgi:hypothetical protein